MFGVVLQEKQAKDAAAARRAAAAAAVAPAPAPASRRGNFTSSRRSGGLGSGSRSNPWAQHQAAQPRSGGSKTVPPRSSIRGAGSTNGIKDGSTAVGDRSVRWTNTIEGVAAGVSSGGTGNGDCSTGGGVTPAVTAATAPPPVYFEEARTPAAICPCCSRVQDAPELTLAGAAGEGGTATARRERVLLPGGSVLDGSSTLEVGWC